MKMKKSILVGIAILLFWQIAIAETPEKKDEYHYPALFKALQIACVTECGIDWGMSCVRINKLHHYEANPLMVWSFKSPYLGAAWMAVQSVALVKITNGIYKKNKMLGWISASALTLIESYLVYTMIKETR